MERSNGLSWGLMGAWGTEAHRGYPRQPQGGFRIECSASRFPQDQHLEGASVCYTHKALGEGQQQLEGDNGGWSWMCAARSGLNVGPVAHEAV